MAKAALAIISLYEQTIRLKRLPRTGWLLAGVTSPESVAEHVFRYSNACVISDGDDKCGIESGR